MIKTLKNLLKQDKERYTVPRKVQDVIPVRRIWKDGIFQVGSRFSLRSAMCFATLRIVRWSFYGKSSRSRNKSKRRPCSSPPLKRYLSRNVFIKTRNSRTPRTWTRRYPISTFV